MPMVATMKPYTLFVVDDDMPLNPRTDYDNLGKMVCWHSRYNLGDEHDYDEPRDFLQKKLFEMYSSYPSSQYGKPIYDFIKSGKAETAKLEYDRSAHEWVLYEKWFGGNEWSKSSSYPASLKGKEVPDWFLDDCLSALEHKELLQLLEQSGKFVILPLYLYDHSGITMNTTGFSCPWDSGQVGWIYADADCIKKEYGKVTPETINKARTVMNGEVETVTAINLAYWLANHGASVCYVEDNTNRHLRIILRMYEAKAVKDHYTSGGIDFYYTDDLDRDYDFIIYDCGALSVLSDNFKTANKRLLCGAALPYELSQYKRVLSLCGDLSLYKLVIGVPEDIKEHCIALIGSDIHFAEPSHSLFDDKVNESIYNEVTADYKE